MNKTFEEDDKVIINREYDEAENHNLIFNILDNNTMMLQGARNYGHCRIQDIKEEKINEY